jgi:hypothetical protein
MTRPKFVPGSRRPRPRPGMNPTLRLLPPSPGLPVHRDNSPNTAMPPRSLRQRPATSRQRHRLRDRALFHCDIASLQRVSAGVYATAYVYIASAPTNNATLYRGIASSPPGNAALSWSNAPSHLYIASALRALRHCHRALRQCTDTTRQRSSTTRQRPGALRQRAGALRHCTGTLRRLCGRRGLAMGTLIRSGVLQPCDLDDISSLAGVSSLSMDDGLPSREADRRRLTTSHRQWATEHRRETQVRTSGTSY